MAKGFYTEVDILKDFYSSFSTVLMIPVPLHQNSGSPKVVVPMLLSFSLDLPRICRHAREKTHSVGEQLKPKKLRDMGYFQISVDLARKECRLAAAASAGGCATTAPLSS